MGSYENTRKGRENPRQGPDSNTNPHSRTGNTHFRSPPPLAGLWFHLHPPINPDFHPKPVPMLHLNVTMLSL